MRRTRVRSRGGIVVVATVAGVLLAVVLVPAAATAVPAAAPQVTAGVAYGDPGDPATQLDVVAPADGKTNRPAVVVVHGGGWTGGSRSETMPDAMELANHGFVAFSIDYHVSSAPRWPTELEDVQRAVRFVQDHAGDYGVDPGAVGLLGSSAGGNLAMLVGTNGTGAGHPPVRAVVSWSGPSDLTTLAITNVDGATLASPPTVPIPGADTPPGCTDDPACIGILGPNYLQAFMDCTLPECPEQYRDASPVFQASSSSAPMLLAGADVDLVPLEQNNEMANALVAAGVHAELFVAPGQQHAESLRGVAMTPTVDFFTRFLVQHADPHVSTNAPPSTAAGSAAIPAVGPDGRLPVPAVPAAAEPRTGVGGFVARHRAASLGIGVGLGALLLVVLVLVVVARRRPRSLTGATP